MAWLTLLGALVPAIHLFRNRVQPGALHMLGLCLVMAAYPLDVILLTGQPAVAYSFALAGLIAPSYLLTVLFFLRSSVVRKPLVPVLIYGYMIAVAIAPWLPGVWYLDYVAEQPFAAVHHYVYQLGVGAWVMKGVSYALIALASAVVVQRFCAARASRSYTLTLAIFPILAGFFDLVAALIDYSPHYGISTVQIASTLGLFVLTFALLRRRMLEHVSVPHRLMMSRIREGVCVLDDTAEIIDCNESMAAIINRPVKALIGRQVSQVFPASVLEQLEAHGRKNNDVLDVELRLPNKRFVSLGISRLSESVGGPATLLSMTDVTKRSQALETAEAVAGELRETNEYLSELSHTDELTGLGNRRVLHDALAERLQEDDSGSTGLIMVDIDHFKAINDTHGHQAGDAVLVSLAQTMRDTCRDNDLIVRWGGEEFVALLGNSDRRRLQLAAERLCLHIRRVVVELDNGVTLQVTASIGATLVRQGQSAESALRQVDRLLYEAKAEGRDRVKSGEEKDS